MPITKAIIPVAGWGTRRLPITKIIEKSMLPVGNRPLVDYSVQELVKAGVTDIYMVISNVEPCQVREFYKDNIALNQYLEARGKIDRLELAKTLPEGVRIHYTSQDPSGKYGTAVPVSMVAEEYNINEPVFVFFGRYAVDDQVAAVVAVQSADDIEKCGLARSAWTENGHKLIIPQIEGDIIERGLLKTAGDVFLVDILKLEHSKSSFRNSHSGAMNK